MSDFQNLTPEQVTKHLLHEQASLTAYAYAVTHNYHLAEDVFQDVCVKAVSQCDHFDSLEHLSNWFRTSSRNHAITLIRSKEGRYVGLSPEMLATMEGEWAKTNTAGDYRSEALNGCLEHLPAKSQKIMAMRYQENRSGEEIAEFMGTKVDSAYQAITRIHRALRDCVGQRLRMEP
ncbi:RNA polymerase sigma factor [Novipirellula artificiosorum]|nr:sigma-70 family RNA polymerase sigma factor [Novipirellula artificiosorum]